MLWVSYVFMFLAAFHVAAASNDADTDIKTVVDNGEQTEPFIATKEWQTVQPNQVLPSGLHIRMNLETGMKEAKLIEHNGEVINSATSNSLIWKEDNTEDNQQPSPHLLDPDKVKLALKRMKSDDANLVGEPKEDGQYRSYSELKQDFEQMNAAIKTETEIVETLVRQLRNVISGPTLDNDDVIRVMSDLQQYLHQIDNAILFSDLGGMELLLKMLNSSVVQLRAVTTSTIGIAMLNNQKVQVQATKSGFLNVLLKAAVSETDVDVQKRTLFALSALLRHFPYAQKWFIESGGLEAICEMGQASEEERVKVKIVTLVDDLVTEQALVESNTDDTAAAEAERLRQYRQLSWDAHIRRGSYCHFVAHLLPLLGSDDAIDKTLAAMNTLHDRHVCRWLTLDTHLQALRVRYVDSDFEYHKELLAKVDAFRAKLLESAAHTEL